MKRTAGYYRKMSERVADVDYALADSLKAISRSVRRQSRQKDRVRRMREVES